MPAPIAANVFPESQQWIGFGRELTTGTIVAPVATIPSEKVGPDEKVTWLDDKSLRGSMAEEYGLVQGVEQSEFDFNGPVYMDTFGYVLHNLMGDYTATGSTPTNSTTLTAQLTAGQTTATVSTIAGYANGQAVQIGVTGDGNPEIVVLSATPSGSTLTFTNTPARFTHASGKAVSTVVAPFTHIFALLNSGNGQPVTHTLTHHQGISTNGAKQYASWCASEAAFTLTAQQAFMHDTKGQSFLGVPAGSLPTNIVSGAAMQASWEGLVGIGGPASGGTLIPDAIEPKITLTRQLKPYWAVTGFQTPLIIARNSFAITGGFTHLATTEQPMLNMLNNVQPQIQIIISNGKTGSNLLSAQFDCQIAAYDTAKLNGNDELEYEVSFKGIANTTNVGQSGGYSPGKVTLMNAIPTY